MKGIIQQHGSYIEAVLKESGSTHLILCFDFKPERPQSLQVRHYRIEYWEQGQVKRQTANDLTEALALFYAQSGGEPEDTSLPKRLYMSLLADRIDKGLCIHCGTSENVVRALCMKCRALPQFQEGQQS
jgi:hypothetical protein